MGMKEVFEIFHIEHRTGGSEHCRFGWIQIDCPFCEPGSQRWHMGYNIVENYFNCWRCGPHRVIGTLIQLDIPWNEINRIIPLINKDIAHIIQAPKTEGRLELPKGRNKLQKSHWNYLTERGYDPHEISRLWHVEGFGIHPKFPWRLFIPIYYRSEVVSWTTRSIGHHSQSIAKYINAKPEQEARNPKTMLYGMDFARHAIIICEGPTDVWRIGPGAVATMGTSVSSNQMLQILQYPVRAICFDQGDAGQKRSKNMAATLSSFPGDTYEVQLPAYADDPGELNAKDVKALRRDILE